MTDTTRTGHLVGYARVSTGDQTTDPQAEELRAAGVERVWTETASGARTDRPILEQLITQVLQPGDTLVVVRLDRLGRSLPHLIEVVGRLNDQGVGLRSLRESIDTTTAGGRLILHVFGALAEFERDLIRERTLAGLASAKAQGRVGGRRPALTKAQVEHAAALIAEGKSVTEVARLLGTTRQTIYRTLERHAA